MTAHEAKKHVEAEGFEYFKYIRLEDDTFEFEVVSAFAVKDHKAMANGRPVKSAGCCGVNTKHCYTEGHSTTLKVGREVDDDERISVLFGVPIRGE